MTVANAIRARPSFALYLVALLALPFKWFSPFSHAQAGWCDVLFAAAAAAWGIEKLRTRSSLKLRPVHAAYAAFLLTTAASAIAAHDHRTAAENLLITAELIGLAVLTADFCSDADGRRLVTRTILIVAAIAVAEALVGLVLFYAGVHSSLVETYSGYFKASDLYTRVAAGFYSAPLLGSFCIFASAVLAMDDNGLSPRTKRWGQVALAALALITLSRAILGFVVGIAVRSPRRLARGVVVGALALIVLLSAAPLTWDPVRPSSSHGTVNPRARTIQTSAQTLGHHPLLGNGPGTLTATWEGIPLRAHLTPLDIAATTGLPALAAFASILYVLWRGRRREGSLAIWSGLAGLGADALSQDAEHFRHIWLMFGLADANHSSTAAGHPPGDPRSS